MDANDPQAQPQELEESALAPTLDEVLDQIERRSKGRLSGADAISAVEAERARR